MHTKTSVSTISRVTSAWIPVLIHHAQTVNDVLLKRVLQQMVLISFTLFVKNSGIGHSHLQLVEKNLFGPIDAII